MKKKAFFLFVFAVLTALVFPDTAQDHFYKALEYQKNGDITNAVYYYSLSIDKDPNNYEAYSNRGNAYTALGRVEEAISDYNMALSLNSSSYETYLNRGYAFAVIRQYDDALSDYEKALSLSPDNPQVYNNRSSVYSAMGKYNEALADCNNAIKLDPDYVYAYNNRGNIYYKMDMLKYAIADYSHAIKLDPENHLSFSNRGNAYYFQDKYFKSFKDFERTVALSPTNAYYYFYVIISSNKYCWFKYKKALNDLKNKEFFFKDKGWEYSLVKFFSGDLSEETLLKEAGSDPELLCEAYCYIGYRHLFGNDKKNAKINFEKCTATGITYFAEYRFSEKELKKL